LKILITGDKGFVGSATRKLLRPYDHLNDWSRGPNGEHSEHMVLGYDAMHGQDIRDIDQLSEYVREHKPERVLHLAAIARFADADADPVLAVETNVQGTRNVAEVCSDYRIPLVYASTGSVYMPIKQKPPITEDFMGCGNSVYGCTKYMGELYVKQSQAPWIILRYAHLYGHEKRMHGLIGGFLDRINRGLAPTLYGGKQSNDFTYISDVARANVSALTAHWDKWRQAYNVGTGEELTAHDAGRMVCEVFGYGGEIEVKEQRTVDPDRFVFDCSKAERMLGFKAKFSFKAGLEDMKNEAGQELQNLAPRVKHAA
jgi:nucleoside-diphosphate-sugar epimerase